MKDAVSRFLGQKVTIHLAANWAVIGTVAGIAGETAEVRDEDGSPPSSTSSGSSRSSPTG